MISITHIKELKLIFWFSKLYYARISLFSNFKQPLLIKDSHEKDIKGVSLLYPY